jgi:hypothetical protein
VLRRDAAGAWTALSVGTGVALHGALVAVDGTELVAGESGTLLYSEDQGATWRVRPLGTTTPLYAIDDL